MTRTFRIPLLVALALPLGGCDMDEALSWAEQRVRTIAAEEIAVALVDYDAARRAEEAASDAGSTADPTAGGDGGSDDGSGADPAAGGDGASDEGSAADPDGAVDDGASQPGAGPGTGTREPFEEERARGDAIVTLVNEMPAPIHRLRERDCHDPEDSGADLAGPAELHPGDAFTTAIAPGCVLFDATRMDGAHHVYQVHLEPGLDHVIRLRDDPALVDPVAR